MPVIQGRLCSWVAMKQACVAAVWFNVGLTSTLLNSLEQPHAPSYKGYRWAQMRWSTSRSPTAILLPLEATEVCFMASQLSQGELSWLAHSVWAAKRSFLNLVLARWPCGSGFIWEVHLDPVQITLVVVSHSSQNGSAWLSLKILITCKTDGFFPDFQASVIFKILQGGT